jgi:acyl-CoA synthetase (AMP-forming)/AMP-acid ligase II
MNIAEILHQHARHHPNQVAIVDRIGGRDREITYGQLEQASSKAASQLRSSGLRANDTVLLFQPMSIELYTALAAIFRCGMTAMFVDPSAGRLYIDRCCELQAPQALIASPIAHLLRLLSPALRRIPTKWSTGRRVPMTGRLDCWAVASGDDTIHRCRLSTPALVSFTSGSTGEPKAVVRTHEFLLAQHLAIEDSLSLVPGDVELVTLPIFVLANLASRVTSVIADADLRRPAEILPDPVVRQIRERQANRLAASPALLDRIVECCEQQSIRLASLKRVFTGGGPVAQRLLERLIAIAPDAEITVVYGATEAEPISTLSTDEIDESDAAAMSGGKGLLVGKPVDSLDVRILSDRWGHDLGTLTTDEFGRLCRAAGDPGEIVVSGNHVLDGYLSGQSRDTNKFRVAETNWHRTGDAGYFDQRGRLWLLGRCSARVDDGHGAIYPLGVEQAALRNPLIRQAAMVSHRGKRVLAVTLRSAGGQPDFSSLLKSLSFANVDSIRIIKRIPMDRRHNSKIDYSELHRLLDRGE